MALYSWALGNFRNEDPTAILGSCCSVWAPSGLKYFSLFLVSVSCIATISCCLLAKLYARLRTVRGCLPYIFPLELKTEITYLSPFSLLLPRLNKHLSCNLSPYIICSSPLIILVASTGLAPVHQCLSSGSPKLDSFQMWSHTSAIEGNNHSTCPACYTLATTAQYGFGHGLYRSMLLTRA